MNGPRMKLGATRAVSTSAVAASGFPEIELASAVMAKSPTQSPKALMTCANHRLEYSRETRKRSRQPCLGATVTSGGASVPDSPPGGITALILGVVPESPLLLEVATSVVR